MIKALITIVIIAALAVGGYFAFRNKNIEETPVQGGDTTTEETPTGKKMAFSEFIKRKESSECTVNVTVNDTITQGKVYIAGDKIRGEYKTDINGQIVDATLISDGTYAYSWSSAAPVGIKVHINPETMTDDAHMFDYDMIGDYNCSLWTPDASKFVIPTNIKFSAVN